jgi:hypothetical protein
MAKKGIWRVGTETPFSTDADCYLPGMTRGEVVLNFLLGCKASGTQGASDAHWRVGPGLAKL